MGQIKVEKNVGGIEGLCVIDPAVHGDARGYFMETYEFSKRSSGMDPAACNFEIPAFFCKFMVDLISICDHSPGKRLQEFPGLFRMAGRLPVKKNDGMGSTQRAVPVDPHISLLTVFDLRMLNPHNLYGCLISMYDFAVIDPFMEPVIDERKIFICTFYHPVCHGIRGKLDSIRFKSFCLSFQRQGVGILAIDNGSDQCRCCNAVAEKVFWSRSFQNRSIIVSGSINMDMVFIHNKCLRDDM